MADEDSIINLFDVLLEDKKEKRILKLIIAGKSPNEIIDDFLVTKKKEVRE